jgi:pimeloyl-ACP methyl ester carboxylesterase
MLRSSIVTAFGFAVVMTSALALNGGPAFGQSLINASNIDKYSQYYAPYAIQAAAAYVSVGQMEAKKNLPAQANQYAIDEIFTNSSVATRADEDEEMSAEKIRSQALMTLQPWQYQFGSDAYLTCLDPDDSECQKNLPGWWRYHRQRGGPAFQVWTHANSPFVPLPIFGSGSCDEVTIAFRGTVQTHRSDLISDAPLPAKYFIDDHYRQLYRNINSIIKRITNLDCYKRASVPPAIVSVGHSLGGGLAQLAALANQPTGPRIEKVFAFDPSPWTGAGLVAKEMRAKSSERLSIDRIYQTGELLSFPRDLVQSYPPAGSPCDPFVRTVRFDAIQGTLLQLHGIEPMAATLVHMSYQPGITNLRPKPPKNCSTLYDEHLHPAREEATIPPPDQGAPQAPPLTPSAQVVDLNRRALPAPSDMVLANVDSRRARYAPSRTVVADFDGLLKTLYTAPRAEVAALGVRRALNASLQNGAANIETRLAVHAPRPHVQVADAGRPRHALRARFLARANQPHSAYASGAKHAKSVVAQVGAKANIATAWSKKHASVRMLGANALLWHAGPVSGL